MRFNNEFTGCVDKAPFVFDFYGSQTVTEMISCIELRLDDGFAVYIDKAVFTINTEERSFVLEVATFAVVKNFPSRFVYVKFRVVNCGCPRTSEVEMSYAFKVRFTLRRRGGWAVLRRTTLVPRVAPLMD